MNIERAIAYRMKSVEVKPSGASEKFQRKFGVTTVPRFYAWYKNSIITAGESEEQALERSRIFFRRRLENVG